MNHAANHMVCMSRQSKVCPSTGTFGSCLEVGFSEGKPDFCPSSPSSPRNFKDWWRTAIYCLPLRHHLPFRTVRRSCQKSMDCLDYLDKPLSMRVSRGCLSKLLGKCLDTWTENRQFALVWGGAQ